MSIMEIAKRIYRRVIVNNDIKIAYHNWVKNNCEKSKYGRKLRKLKDIHKGERCIIVGNGPSLTAEDLDAIHDAGIVTFGTNRVFKIFPDTKWRPTYYVAEDPNVFKGFCKEIDEVPARLKFIPLQIIWYEANYKFKDTLFFWQNFIDEKKYPYGFSSDISRQIDHNHTVTCTCIEIAAYMGFSEIYLIGVDHNYRVSKDESGNIVVDNTVKDHFCADYDNDATKNGDLPEIALTTRSYRNMKSYCDENNIKICNATRGGKLEVFSRMPFGEILCERNH